jgi:3-methylcrotonyl-CoA carboxylase alpha subunit
MFARLLIANRGEIACRIVRTARRMGIETIAVYSDADRNALHARSADRAIRIGAPAARESYLDVAAVLAAARDAGAEAIHPGYGFLSENEDFAEACAAAGLLFVGPPATAIRAMGSKSEARRLMAAAGVPVLPGYDGSEQDEASLRAAAQGCGFPLLIKPTAGGGGKGMRIVRVATEFDEALAGARREASKAFGDERVLLERFVEQGRHIEIQVFADAHGNVVHLHERDCSLQRRHQKVVEEAPASRLPDSTRRAMGEAAVVAARTVDYRGAGTIEFLYDGSGFYFLEMNTRLQVEHPVTELVTGVDLVEWQLRVAAGEPLPLRQEQLQIDGHAIEARLYAEDPARGFLPSTGRLHRLRWPSAAPGLRIDAGVAEGDEVTLHYDPMLAKLIAHGPDRATALERLRAALGGLAIEGVRTNARFLWELLGDPAVREGAPGTRWIEQSFVADAAGAAQLEQDAWLVAALLRSGVATGVSTGAVTGAVPGESSTPWASTTGLRLNAAPVRRVAMQCAERRAEATLEPWRDGWVVRFDGSAHRMRLTALSDDLVRVQVDGREREFALERAAGGESWLRAEATGFGFGEDRGAPHRASAEHEGHLRAPMPGHVLEVRAQSGQVVEAGTVLVLLEAMKMEHSLLAPWAGTVTEVRVAAGERVEEGAELVILQPSATAVVGTVA